MSEQIPIGGVPTPPPAAHGGDIMKLFEGPDEESLAEDQRASLKAAREAFRELEKLIKNIGLYGLEHQSIERFRHSLHLAITQMLGELGEVTVLIGPYDFLLFEQSIYQNQNPEKNFIYKFFSDGVRRLRFSQGIDPKELDDFVDVLLTDWDDPALFEDDAVTRMWEKDFSHIEYHVVESFSEDTGTADGAADYTVEKVVDTVRSGENPAGGAVASPGGAGGGAGGGKFSGGRGGPRRAVPVIASLAGSTITAEDLERFEEAPFAMDEQEFETLKSLVLNAGRQTLGKFIEILFKVDLSEKDQRQNKAGQLFKRIAELLLTSGRIVDLEETLGKLRSLTGPAGELIFENVEAINRIFEQWDDEEFVTRLFDHYCNPEFAGPEAVVAVCRLLNPGAAVYIADQAGRVTIPERRQVVFDLLPEIIGDRVKELGRILRKTDRAHAHDLLRVLRSVDHPDVQTAINAALANPDSTVRLEALSTIPVDRLEAYVQYLLAAANDESKMVRSKAIQLLARVATPEVHQHLRQRIASKELGQLEIDEKRRYYAAAALTGNPAEAFMKALQSRGFLQRKGNEEARACSAVALALRLHKPAIPVMQKEIRRRSTSELVRDACIWGLKHMQCSREERTRQLYDIFFRGELTTAPTAGGGR